MLVDVLDALDVGRVDVVGVDTGGALAQLMMANHRDRVERVVLTACDAFEAFPPRRVWPLFTAFRAPGAVWLVAQLARLQLVRRLVTMRPVVHTRVDDSIVRRWVAPLLDADVRRDLAKVLASMSGRHTLAAAEANTDFPRPVLIAWGDDARIFPSSLGERLAESLPDARLVTLPDCAAFAALDQPQALADLIVKHVGDPTGRRSVRTP